MEVYFESMTKVVYSRRPWEQLIIRVWRNEIDEIGEEEMQTKNNAEIHEALMKLNLINHSKKEIAEWLLQIDRMNAVEVLDHTGFGVVLYKDWP